MQGVRVCVLLLALLLPWHTQCQRRVSANAELGAEEDLDRNLLASDILNRGGGGGGGILSSLFPPAYGQHRPTLRQARAPPRPASQAPKRTQHGTRLALSLDVPTSILSVLIDLAKNQDMRAKAAQNAELMARIGRRK